ncbi:MAG: hypothetical protein JRF48_14135 [Deltaproteobacteria bacterium]|nr:hypothetical protein [Deltaproteobacteria bacterium]
MEGVEDIPGTALSEGISWGWESFPEYMDVLDRMPHTIDFLAHVPHDALRVYVMGERGVHDEAATPEDIAEMRRLLRAALETGAIGFSTGRSDNHRSAVGDLDSRFRSGRQGARWDRRGIRGLGLRRAAGRKRFQHPAR